ncbi:ribonuclease HII [Nocardioides daejeonensis]|uniref:ribonuclease HII n=1 Tax=Nocardioides daejeonensis TaxID=1046556 RepID=UPI000D74DE03|nr:ribonuclease HII [Nocardioides daejeonensis]
MVTPTLRLERRLLRDGVLLLGCADEVGRGALCGPVTIGVVVIDLKTKTAPSGVRDSKLLPPEVRERLAPKIRRWALAHGVGHATPAEIDRFGIMAALRMAGHRALIETGLELDLVLLDGNHDYLTPPPQLDLLDPVPTLIERMPAVRTEIKADLRCAAVAAASILAKTARDALMVELAPAFPAYGWEHNKGYSAPEHLRALAEHGPTEHHRRSWNLPGVESAPLVEPVESAPLVEPVESVPLVELVETPLRCSQQTSAKEGP